MSMGHKAYHHVNNKVRWLAAKAELFKPLQIYLVLTFDLCRGWIMHAQLRRHSYN